MPQIIDTIRFLEWGKPAPANSEFKGVISTEKIFGTGNEGSYFGYTSRSTATESSGNEKLTMTEDGFLGYTSRDYASGGSTFSSMGWLDQDKAEEFKAEGRKAFSEKGDLIWDAVIALEDFEAAHKNGLFHTADYADAMSKVLPRFFKTVGLDPVNMLWWMNYHNNTDHPHIHLCFLEKTHTRSRGKFTPRQLKEFKRLVIKELTARETLSEISGVSYDEAFRRKDAERNVFLDQIRSINLLEIDSISKLASVLPKKGRLQYNSANLRAYRGQIDAITDSFLQMPEIKPAFDLYLDHLELFDQAINKNAGTDVATLKEAELKRLYAQIGNIILKTIRDTGALSRKKWKDSNIIDPQLTELEDGTMKSEKGWEFKRYSELKDKLIETAVKPTSEQGMEYRRIYAGFLELMETAENETLKYCILHRIAKIEYEGLGGEKNLFASRVHCVEAIRLGSRFSYPLLYRIHFAQGAYTEGLRALYAGKGIEDPVSMYLLGKELLRGQYAERYRIDALEYIRESAKEGFLPAKQYLARNDQDNFIKTQTSDSILSLLADKTKGHFKGSSVGTEVAGYLNNDDEIRITPANRMEAEIDAYLKEKKTPIRRTR